jgi:hypothetical protein
MITTPLLLLLNNGRFFQQPVNPYRLLEWVDLFGEERVDLGCELV